VNNHPDFKVRRIRSDNGTEFKNSVMRLFCEENGIMHEFSAARTPQQNGVVERKNRSLIEATRSMLEELKLPTYFRAEVINTACYTQNISLQQGMNNFYNTLTAFNKIAANRGAGTPGISVRFLSNNSLLVVSHIV
ncbi:MAG: hypothetical protein Q8829_03000, partial [Candidatus Phytoplasma australasiaticum]|nr:hypothetical protein [Candidatus Phytoplasma australasiaticum]